VLRAILVQETNEGVNKLIAMNGRTERTLRPLGSLERLLGPLRSLKSRFWLPFAGACFVVFVLELAVESPERSFIRQRIFDFSGWYQRIVAAPRSPVPRYTVVIEINTAKDPTIPALTDLCGQRHKMSSLLHALAAARPAVVVFDKLFSQEPPYRSCPADEELISAIGALRSKNIPVIVGRQVDDDTIGKDSAARYYLIPSFIPDDRHLCESREVNMDYAAPQVPCLEGVINMDLDSRKLPLGWWLYESRQAAEAGKGAHWYSPLALEAARAYDDKLMEHHPRLAGLVRDQQNPYISFLSEEDFEAIHPQQVLKATPESSRDMRKISGKVVLIGEVTPRFDEHATVAGKMHGVYMQANYIEALLDDRYFRPATLGKGWIGVNLDYVFGFFLLMSLELILIAYHDRWLMTILMIAVLLISSLGVLYLTVMHFGRYVNPSAVGGFAIVIKLSQLIIERIARWSTGKTKGGSVTSVNIDADPGLRTSSME